MKFFCSESCVFKNARECKFLSCITQNIFLISELNIEMAVGGVRPCILDELYPRTMLKHKIRPITRLQGTVGGKQMLRNYHNYSALIG